MAESLSALRHMLVRSLLEEGEPIELSFAGNSMLPLITGADDHIILAPLAPDEVPQVGEVYLFQTAEDCFIVHRLLRVGNDTGSPYIFRGDHNYAKEQVARKNILARLVEVHYADGSVVRTDSTEWHRRSRCVLFRRRIINGAKYLVSNKGRARLRPYYFLALIILMWAPLNGLGVPLDNFVFGIRLDHLLHASVFLPCAFYLYGSISHSRPGYMATWLIAVLVGVISESVQYLLPYRGFDINDMVSNFLGVTLGWLICYLVYRKRHRVSR